MPIIYRLVDKETGRGAYDTHHELASKIQHTGNNYTTSSYTPSPEYDPLLIKRIGISNGNIEHKLNNYIFGFESLTQYFAWFSKRHKYKRRVKRHLQLQQLYVPLHNIICGTKQCIFLVGAQKLINNLSPITGKPI